MCEPSLLPFLRYCGNLWITGMLQFSLSTGVASNALDWGETEPLNSGLRYLA